MTNRDIRIRLEELEREDADMAKRLARLRSDVEKVRRDSVGPSPQIQSTRPFANSYLVAITSRGDERTPEIDRGE
jgi:hypothetical protein